MSNVETELEILNLIIKYKPIGIHKNFRLLNILMKSTLESLPEILGVIQRFYNLSQASQNSISDDEDLFIEREFDLPDHEFSSIIEEYRLQTEDDLSRDVSPVRNSISGTTRRDSTVSNQPLASATVSVKRRTTRNTSQTSQKRSISKRKR